MPRQEKVEILAKSILDTAKGSGGAYFGVWEVGERDAVGRLQASGPSVSRSRGRSPPGVPVSRVRLCKYGREASVADGWRTLISHPSQPLYCLRVGVRCNARV